MAALVDLELAQLRVAEARRQGLGSAPAGRRLAQRSALRFPGRRSARLRRQIGRALLFLAGMFSA